MNAKVKKWLILGGSVIGVIAVLVIFCFTLFAVRTVFVNPRTSTDLNFPTQEQIVEAGGVPYGKPVFFVNKSKIKENIEQAYPYVEVVNIETVFPAKLIVHVRQRQEVYAFVHGNNIYYCDNNLIVLRSEEGTLYTSIQANPILISGLGLDSQEIKIGEKLEVTNYVDVYNALLENNRLLHEQMSMISSIGFSSHTDEITQETAPCFYITTFDGHEYRIFNTDKYLKYKMQKFLTAYSGLYDLVGENITTDESSSYYGQTWTKEMLDSAYVVINNFYQVSSPENSCYANVFPQTIS